MTVVQRVVHGQHPNGATGLFVSKPGIDVFSALPGQFLIDSNSSVYQVLASGQNAYTNPPATFQTTIPLPAQYAALSRLWMIGWVEAKWVNYGTNIALDFSVTNYSFYYRVQNGQIVLNLNGFNFGTDSNPTTTYFSWIVFRAGY